MAALTRTEHDTFAFEHDGVEIRYPLLSECGRFEVSPALYGFTVWDTGGGSSAWGRNFTLDGKPVHMMLTSPQTDRHEIAPGGPVQIEVVAGGGEAFVSWVQDVIATLRPRASSPDQFGFENRFGLPAIARPHETWLHRQLMESL